jgi:[protein-PII] uridylyltransferase
VIDTFYVTDLTGHKIDSPTRQAKIRTALVAVLEGRPAQGDARAAAG